MKPTKTGYVYPKTVTRRKLSSCPNGVARKILNECSLSLSRKHDITEDKKNITHVCTCTARPVQVSQKYRSMFSYRQIENVRFTASFFRTVIDVKDR